MLRPRIIPFLLISNNDLIKTINFKNEKYIGDPLNAVRLFNEKKCDEIGIFDIDLSINNKKPNFKLIKDIANESRMPITYGGGIKNKNDAIEIFNYGIEKISVSSLYFENKDEVLSIIDAVGSQSMIVTLDIRLIEKNYCAFVNRGKDKINISLDLILRDLKEIGIGEIIINNIDKEGTMQGYDLKLLEFIYQRTNMQITNLGGVGSENDLKSAIKKFGSIGYGCSSFFLYKGPRKAVLLSYKNFF